MEKRCQNERCNKILLPRDGKKSLNPKRIFCDDTCRTRQGSYQRFLRLRNDPTERFKRQKTMKRWYSKIENKEKQKKHVLNNYHKNKKIWGERSYVDSHRDKFLELINQKCKCGQPVKIIHHMTYNFKRGGLKQETRLRKLEREEYAQFLIGFCSKKCHCAHHRLSRGKDYIHLNTLNSLYKQ